MNGAQKVRGIEALISTRMSSFIGSSQKPSSSVVFIWPQTFFLKMTDLKWEKSIRTL